MNHCLDTFCNYEVPALISFPPNHLAKWVRPLHNEAYAHEECSSSALSSLENTQAHTQLHAHTQGKLNVIALFKQDSKGGRKRAF